MCESPVSGVMHASARAQQPLSVECQQPWKFAGIDHGPSARERVRGLRKRDRGSLARAPPSVAQAPHRQHGVRDRRLPRLSCRSRTWDRPRDHHARSTSRSPDARAPGASSLGAGTTPARSVRIAVIGSSAAHTAKSQAAGQQSCVPFRAIGGRRLRTLATDKGVQTRPCGTGPIRRQPKCRWLS